MLLDDIYKKIGDRGPYQVGLWCIIMVVSVPCGWHHMSITFLGAKMDHWCRIEELDALNLTADQYKHLAIPLDPNEGHNQYSKCFMYDLNFSSITLHDTKLLHYDDTLRSSDVREHRDVSSSDDTGGLQSLNGTGVRRCDAGWVYDLSMFTMTAMNKWDLVCDSEWLLSMIQTVYMAGVMTGCLLFGQLSDRVGRLNTVVISTIGLVVSALLAAFTPWLYLWMLLRFCAGGCAAGGYTTVFVMSMEMIGPSYRMEGGIWVQGWFAIGIMTIPVFSYFVRDMFWLQIIIGTIPAVFVSYYWFVPESPRWLIAEGRDEEAEKVLKLMAKINKSEVPEPLHLEENRLKQTKNENLTIFDLFRTPNLRLTTILMYIAWFTASCIYYGLSLGVSLLKGSLFFNTFLTGVVELPAYVLSCVALNKIGRRWPTIVTFIGGGLMCCLATPFLLTEGYDVALITVMMIGKGLISAAFAQLYVYSAELFPTLLRNVGVGSSSMMARVGGLVQPQIQLMHMIWPPLPFILYGGLALIGGAVTLYFPETLNQPLPETMEEAENFKQHVKTQAYERKLEKKYEANTDC